MDVFYGIESEMLKWYLQTIAKFGTDPWIRKMYLAKCGKCAIVVIGHGC